MLIHIGFGNIVNTEKIIAVVSPESAPIKRLVQGARENALKTGRDAQRWADRGLVRDAGTVWAEIGNLSDAKASRIMPRGIWRANAQKL